MNAHIDNVDDIQAQADAYRAMNDADKIAVLRLKYDRRASERFQLDAELDELQAERTEMEARHNAERVAMSIKIETALAERTQAHRDVAEATKAIAYLEQRQGV